MFNPWVVAAIALKTSLLIVAVGLLALLAAKRSAAWRHVLWTSALVLSLLMPFAVAYLPATLQLPLPWLAAEVRVLDETGPAAAESPPSGEELAAPRARNALDAGADREPRAPWPAVAIVWLIGAMGVGLRVVLAHVGLMRWARAARDELPPAWSMTLRHVMKGRQLRRPLRVLATERTDSACTWGFLRPTLLLPAAGADWPDAQRRFALLHELAHVRRFDYLTTQVASLACALHWYNPLVWLAAAQARKLQELACDDAVLNDGGTPSAYAGFLVGIAAGTLRPSPAFPAAVGMLQRSQLHGRVDAILDASRARFPVTGLALLAAAVPLIGLMLVLATVSAVAASAAQGEIPLAASFRDVELRNGGRVTLVHGVSQRVVLIAGDPAQAAIAVGEDGRLVIDRCPAATCTHGHFEVEVTTPALRSIAVSEGGIIQSRDGFPHQSRVALAVSQGGVIDVRTLPVSEVSASVFSGGMIFSQPGAGLAATVEQGGIVTYWGDPVVRKSIRHGGVVTQGAEADVARPLADMEPGLLPPIPPVPAVAAIPPLEPIRQ